MKPISRLLPATLAFALAAASGAVIAQSRNLPDIGSSAGNVLSPAKQAEYGAMVLAQLRHEGYIIDDPLLDGWMRDVGSRLGGASERPNQPFTFFMLRDRQINAFATLGSIMLGPKGCRVLSFLRPIARGETREFLPMQRLYMTAPIGNQSR